MKNVLFVVDEKMMGGVSVLLSDMLNMMDLDNLNVDLLVLHNRGDMLTNLPKKVNIIYGTSYFDTVDLTIKEVLKSKNLKKIFHKVRLVLDMKTGIIKKRVLKERKKILNKHYDYEIAFKDGFTAIFSAYSDSKVKYHWIQYDYSTSNPNSKYPRLMNDVLQKFDKIIAISDGIKNDFNKIYHLEDKVVVIENLVDTNRIKDKAKEKCDEKIDKDKLNIVLLGRIRNSHKGFDRVVDASFKLKNEGLLKNTVIRIYGDGPDKEILQKQIDDQDLEEYIFIKGKVDNPYKYLKGNDLFILPSRYEAFGLVVVESLTLNVPVLALDNAIISKLVSNKYGMVLNNSDRDLYEGMKKILSNRDVLKKYKDNLKNYNYDNKKILKQLNDLFK